MKLQICLLIAVLILAVESRLSSRNFLEEKSLIRGDFPPAWFSQTLDHFNHLDKRTFLQRYWVNDKYWNQKNGPIFLYINGEGPVSNPPYQEDDLVVILAKEHEGIIVTLEHRYYGLSHPFDSLETENLQYLSSRQALNDLAHFVVHFRDNIYDQYNVPRFDSSGEPNNLKIFTIGVSYSGALSAWFRLKYPHITVGSLSSSGVVHAILSFDTFDQQIPISVGDECANVLRLTVKELETLVLHGDSTTNQQTKAKFGAQMLVDDKDFFLMIADVMAESVQYGYQSGLCTPLVSSYQSNGTAQLVDTLVNVTKNVWDGTLGDPYEYATAHLQNTTVKEEWADRQWWFQCCSELAYFQVAPAQNSIRSHVLDLDYFKNLCNVVFGDKLWPDVDATNVVYGGNHTAATKVFFANGSQDPWQWASVREPLSSTEPARTVTCDNCGHGVDVRGCPNGCNNSNLEAVRAEIKKHVKLWLDDSQ